MKANELLKLAERVEGLTGPDREVDAAIALSLGWKRVDNPTNAMGLMGRWYDANGKMTDHFGVPSYTASLDAAMTLVPEGWVVGQMSWWPHAKSATTHMDNMHGLKACSGAVSLPLSICAAALRAHASAMEGEG